MKMVQTVLINGQDVNQDKRITNKALLELCSNITMYEGFLCGHTSDEGASPVSWMVMGWKMKVFRHVKMFSKVRVETWVQSYTKVRILRNYAMYDEEGNVIAMAAGEWIAADGEKGTFLRMKPELLAAFEILEEKNNFPGYQFPDVRTLESLVESSGESSDQSSATSSKKTKLVTPGLQMADYNGHVHNSEYLNLAAEITPQAQTCDNVEIIFRTQILPGKEVLLELVTDASGQKVAIKNPEDNSLHAVVILS